MRKTINNMLKGCRKSNSRLHFECNQNLLKSKRSQITIFIIVAIILVGLIIGMFSFTKNANKSFGATTAPGVMNELTLQRDKCLNDLTIEALDVYGLNQNKISTHLNSGFLNCILPVINGYNRQFDINYTSPIITSSVNNDQIKIILDMALSVGKDGELERIEGKESTHLRTISMNLNSDSNCVLKNDAAIVSFDGKFDMHVSKGTKATKEDGSCLDKITLTLKDPQVDYGGREKSYTSIAYVMGPQGARFDKDIIVKQKYSLKDYTDYARAALASNSYVMPENWMKVQYYDPANKNYYVYPAEVTLAPDTYTNKKVITSKINQFYGAQLTTDSSCKVLKNTVIESPDRRVSLKLTSGTTAINNDGSCVRKIEIKEGPKTSRVVNFGDRDYQLLPEGATFGPEIIYTYRYTQKQIQNPVFLYGAQNWKDIINNNWTSPVEDYAPYLTINSPEDNSTVLKGDADFNFRATDDLTSQLNCSLFINYVKQNSSKIITSGTNNKITAKLDKEGPYNYFIQCSDGLNVGETDVITIEVVNSSSISLTGLAIKEFNDVKYSLSNKITGKVISRTANINGTLVQGGTARVPGDLRIAYDDNGVYRPWPTTVDETNKLVISKLTHFSFNIVAQGCTDVYSALLEISSVPLDGNGNCTVGKAATQTSNTYTVTRNEACVTGNVKIVYQTSPGDNQGAMAPNPTDASAAGQHTIIETTLTEGNGQSTTGVSGAVCAYTLASLDVQGIGVSSDSDQSGCLGNVVEDNTNGGCKGRNLNTLCEGPIGGSHACFNTAVCDALYGASSISAVSQAMTDPVEGSGSVLEGCYACVSMENNEGNEAGNTLDYCSHAVLEGGIWSEAYCMATYSGLELEGCLACVRMYQTGGDGGHTLNYCTHAVIGEGGTTVAYQAATCSANTGGYKSSAGIVGYMVGDWWRVSAADLATELYNAGLNYTYVELLSDPYSSITKPELQLPLFKTYVESMRAKNITTIVNLVHGKLNDGEGDYICQAAFGDAYFNNILNYVNNTIGPDKVIIGANHEWVGGCQERRTGEISTLLSYGTPAEKMFYMSAKGTNHYMTIHSAPGESFPSGALNVMDGGDILKMTSTVNSEDGSISAVSDKLEAYAKSVIACGSGIIYYGYAQKSIDTVAIQALAAAKAG